MDPQQKSPADGALTLQNAELSTAFTVESPCKNPAQEPSLQLGVAAVMLQCAIRRMVARKLADVRRKLRAKGQLFPELAKPIKAPPEPNSGANNDEECMGGMLAECSAVVIQSKVRQVLAKKKMAQLRREKEEGWHEEVQASLRFVSVVTLQQAFRRFKAKLAAKREIEKSFAALSTPRKGSPLRSPTTPGLFLSTTEGALHCPDLNTAFSVRSMVNISSTQRTNSLNQTTPSEGPSRQNSEVKRQVADPTSPVPSLRISSPTAAGPLQLGVAAVMLQCAIRRMVARKLADVRRKLRAKGQLFPELAKPIKAPPEPNSGANNDEECMGGMLAECSAVVIQSKVRQVLAKKKMAQLRREKEEGWHEEVQASLRFVSVVTLQQAFRRFKAKKAAKLEIEKSFAVADRSQSDDAPPPQRKSTLSQLYPTPTAETAAAHTALCAVPISLQTKSFGLLKQIHVDLGALPSLSPSTLAKKKRAEIAAARQMYYEEPSSPERRAELGPSNGYGLGCVFVDATRRLLDMHCPVKSMWGIRIFHCVAMEVKSSVFLPDLAMSLWIQGPLGSIVPATRRMLHWTTTTAAHNQIRDSKRLLAFRSSSEPLASFT